MDSSSLRAALGVSALLIVACDSRNSGGADAGSAASTTDAGETNPHANPTPDSGTPAEPTAGCGKAGVTTGFVGRQSITVDGATRTYELYVPEAYDGKKTYPVVFVFHGDGDTGAGIRDSFNLEQESGSGAIFVYPDGLNETWVITEAAGLTADVAFVDAIAADLGKSHCTDAKRVFAVGFSRGAYFTNMLACLSKSNLRAIVTHSGGGPFDLDGTGTSYDGMGNLRCPSAPVAALQVHGSADDVVAPSEGIEARDHWRIANGCNASSTAYDPSPCIAYDGCAPGRPEVWCEIPGMGHTIWPENGTKVTWAFLKTK
jgi:polyhydroxybutyrate depolymerase